MVVLDTNIILDLLVFSDPATQPLASALGQGGVQWIATVPMREELQRVLAYPQIVKSLIHHGRCAQRVLDAFDAQAQLLAIAPKATVTCKDTDDQKFIDLAVLHQTRLLSKDRAVLCMKKRLLTLGVKASTAIEFVA